MALAAAADVAALLARELEPAELALVERRLAQVERMIVRRIPDLDAQIAGGELDEDDVRDISAEAVYRAVRNPDGITSETDGTYTYAKTREAADSSLRILPDEWEVLGVHVGKMFAIAPAIGGLR